MPRSSALTGTVSTRAAVPGGGIAALTLEDIPSRFLRIMEHFIEAGDDCDVPADKMTGLLKEIVALAKRLRPSSFVGSGTPLLRIPKACHSS